MARIICVKKNVTNNVAKNKKYKRPLQDGFYSEPGFVSLTSKLREISGDNTVPTGNYVDIFTDIKDMVTPDVNYKAGGVIDIDINEDKTELVITYANGETKKLSIDDGVVNINWIDL
jgi:hypothetical protein